MKNSPESVLKKMYTSQKRAWHNNMGFRHCSSISMTSVVPDAVIPLTGNTTVKLDLEQFLLSEGTPNPVYEGMRLDINLYFCPQRLYTRGMYGNNIVEGLSLEQLPLPSVSLFKPYDSLVQDSSVIPMVLRGSLLNRLGVPTFAMAPGANIPLVSKHVPSNYHDMSLREAGAENKSYPLKVNASVVAAYYDICRSYFANFFEDLVPISESSTFEGVEVGPDSNPVPGSVSGGGVSWESLASFASTINHIRGVMNPGDYSIPTLSEIFTNDAPFTFGVIPLVDFYAQDGDTDSIAVAQILALFEDRISDTGLWPNRYDGHFQTRFFQADDINSLYDVSTGENLMQVRLQEAKFATFLKSILHGRTTEDWVDAQYGRRLKLNDKPIFVGSDSFIVSFDQIVASAQTNPDGTQNGVRLGDTAGRAKGGSRRAFDDKGNVKSKTISFTTQEPGYLISVITCTPPVSYSDNLPRFHEYDTLADFPLPSYSGKTFQDLRGSDFVFTGLDEWDNDVVGVQPYAFDYMQNYNRVSGLMATRLKRGFTFIRQFDLEDFDSSWDEDYFRYLRSVYVEPDTFDNNFYDSGINGRQNFSLLTAYNLRLCQPLEKQLLDYTL